MFASDFLTAIAVSQIHSRDASPAAKIAQLEQALIAKDVELKQQSKVLAH
eukprot:COSAG02_NODE_915_length_15986_cov_16.498584_2_plen_50_part_00